MYFDLRLLIKGPSIKDVRKILPIFTPLPPPNSMNFQTLFYPTFFPLQLNPTLYLKRKHLVPVKNITIFPFDYLNPSLITNKKKLLVELHRLLYIVNLLQQACPLSQIRSDHIKLCNRILHSQKN